MDERKKGGKKETKKRRHERKKWFGRNTINGIGKIGGE